MTDALASRTALITGAGQLRGHRPFTQIPGRDRHPPQAELTSARIAAHGQARIQMIDRRQPPPTPIGYLDQPRPSIPLNRLPIPMIALGLDGYLGYANSARPRASPRPPDRGVEPNAAHTAGRAFAPHTARLCHYPVRRGSRCRLLPRRGPPGRHLGLTSATHARQRPDPGGLYRRRQRLVLGQSMTRAEGSSVQYATKTAP
jgi:hypothetical protein